MSGRLHGVEQTDGEWEKLGQCGCCGCGPVPTYPVGGRGEYFDDARRACHYCLRARTPETWGESD